MASHDDAPRARPRGLEKQPLVFQEGPVAPGPEMPERRLLLKFVLMGAVGAAFLPKDLLHAGVTAKQPVRLPYTNLLSFESQPGTVADADGNQAQYLVTGSGHLDIDGNGTVFLSNIEATASYVSGVFNVG
ncbi:MAG TPA: hypothetical protein VMM92_00060, partial [Thermoanaerobaculia bacterium]|nr:hypothetical protein [Thermoanaerobaculia bacterium]